MTYAAKLPAEVSKLLQVSSGVPHPLRVYIEGKNRGGKRKNPDTSDCPECWRLKSGLKMNIIFSSELHYRYSIFSHLSSQNLLSIIGDDCSGYIVYGGYFVWLVKKAWIK